MSSTSELAIWSCDTGQLWVLLATGRFAFIAMKDTVTMATELQWEPAIKFIINLLTYSNGNNNWTNNFIVNSLNNKLIQVRFTVLLLITNKSNIFNMKFFT